MREGGWIKLYRAIEKNWIWEDPVKLKWWLDILLHANHQDKKIILGNELTLIERGTFHTSILKLAERWKVDRKTVKKFLDLLQSDSMISLKTSKKGTTVKISNYEDYQAISDGQSPNKMDNSMDNKVPIEWTDKSQQGGQISPNKVDTNKNDKNIKNDNNDKERKEEVQAPLPFPSPFHEVLFNNFGDVGYKTWFSKADVKEDTELITITVAEGFIKKVIQERYLEQIRLLTVKRISVEVVG